MCAFFHRTLALRPNFLKYKFPPLQCDLLCTSLYCYVYLVLHFPVPKRWPYPSYWSNISSIFPLVSSTEYSCNPYPSHEVSRNSALSASFRQLRTSVVAKQHVLNTWQYVVPHTVMMSEKQMSFDPNSSFPFLGYYILRSYSDIPQFMRPVVAITYPYLTKSNTPCLRSAWATSRLWYSVRFYFDTAI